MGVSCNSTQSLHHFSHEHIVLDSTVLQQYSGTPTVEFLQSFLTLI